MSPTSRNGVRVLHIVDAPSLKAREKMVQSESDISDEDQGFMAFFTIKSDPALALYLR